MTSASRPFDRQDLTPTGESAPPPAPMRVLASMASVPAPRRRASASFLAMALATAMTAGFGAPSARAAESSAEAASAPTSTATATALPTVQTDMKRGTFMPYKTLNEILSKLRTEGEGLFVTRFQLHDLKERDKPPAAGTKLALMSDEEYIPIPIDEKGRFDLPTFSEAKAKGMELGSNTPPKSMGIQLSIDIATPPEQLDMNTVRRIVTVGQRLRGELLPWYLRWLFPQIDGVIMCSDQPQWALEWPEGGQRLRLDLPVDPKIRESGTPKDQPSRPCTALTGQEQWPDGARLMPPAGGNTKLWVLLRKTRPS